MKDVIFEVKKLRENSPVAYVGSVNEAGFPQIKGMLVFEHGGMKTQYFSTNTSSKRVGQFLENPKACVYYCDETKDKYKGALFTGTIEVCTDHGTKAMLWRDGCEIIKGNFNGQGDEEIGYFNVKTGVWSDEKPTAQAGGQTENQGGTPASETETE